MYDFFINQPDNVIPASITTSILKNSRSLQYHTLLQAYQPTPLVSLPGLAGKYGVESIYIKNEARRFGLNAFKGLGASYAIHQLLKSGCKTETFCTATDGNHGKAVAWASGLAGKKSVVFVPKDTVLNRIIAIEKEGAIVIKTDVHYDETCEIARKKCEKEGWQLVQDTASSDYEEIPAQIMAGYLTMFQEMEDSLHILPKPKIDIVFLQAGVGSFASSAIWYYINRYGVNRPKIILVEPYEADGFLESFRQGKRTVPHGNYQTIMAGLNCGLPSLSAWEIIKNTSDVIMKVRDDFAEKAIRELYYPEKNDESIVAGESGVAGLAGFIALMTQQNMQALKKELQIGQSSNILFINTEGATDPDMIKIIINKEKSKDNVF